MKMKWIIGWVVVLVLATSAWGQQLKCSVCGAPLIGTYYKDIDQLTGETNLVCADCEKLDRCSVCGLPVKTGFTRLMDGRILCARETAAAICSEDEAQTIVQNAHSDIDRLFSRYMDFPTKNVEVSFVDKFHLQNLFFAPGFQSACATVNGATASNPLGDGKYLHTIDLLTCMSKTHLMAVSAHEYTHAWMNENANPGRVAALDRDTKEAFCELVAYKYMANRNETLEMGSIRRNGYTRGKINVLIAADEKYGFNAVVEWVKAGEDNRLDLANLDRIRAVRGTTYSPRSVSVTWTPVPAAAPTLVPNTLKLKGISGSEEHRFALINNTTFEPMEKASVRVGQTNVSVRCLEIRPDSVIIQVDGSNHTQQLFLQASN